MKLRPHSQSADRGPIDPAVRDLMNVVAHALDDAFNGENCKAEDKRVGFFLTTFNFNEPGGRFNYISNADKLEVRTMLHDILARIEARMMPEGNA